MFMCRFSFNVDTGRTFSFFFSLNVLFKYQDQIGKPKRRRIIFADEANTY